LAGIPLLVVLTGPSAAGKDSLLAHLKSLGRPYHFVVTATTRPKRRGEEAEAGYQFLRRLSLAKFEGMLARGELLEHAEVYGHRYGVPRQPVREALASGRDALMRTDVQGARYIKGKYPSTVTIFVAPPSEAEMERRLRGRASDTAEQIELRLRKAKEEMAASGEFDYTVVNDDLGRCAAEIERIMERERARPGRAAVVV